MKNFTMLLSRKTSTLLALGAASAILGAANLALAASTPPTIPGVVEYPSKLMVQISGVNYLAQAASPCAAIPARSIDTIKIWQSLAQGALLANKNVIVYYETCSNGERHITDIVLLR